MTLEILEIERLRLICADAIKHLEEAEAEIKRLRALVIQQSRKHDADMLAMQLAHNREIEWLHEELADVRADAVLLRAEIERLREEIARLRLTPEAAYLQIVEGWLRDNRGIHFTEGAVDDLCKRIARALEPKS